MKNKEERGSKDMDELPNTFVKPPSKIPFLFKIGLLIAKKETGKDLLPARLLTWYPRAAIGSGVLEMMTAKGGNKEEQRILNLVRLQTSLICSCRFCIDMNALGIEKNGITDQELEVLQGKREIQDVNTFSLRELLALEYAVSLSITPPDLAETFIKNLTQQFSEKEIVMLASTIASVNYWARLNQGLGVPPAGFSDRCLIYQKNKASMVTNMTTKQKT
ncbi:carboxymuconolactone decarboxylase family protein [Eubacteriaceae bacterium ES2]|nr:carboxymuconolactone decarboxylase family protein [Eubacteriaceae bacterium ES2]